MELARQGRTIYNLSVGTPDFETPAHIREAVSEAAKDPENFKYSLTDRPFLKKAVRDFYLRRFGVSLEDDEVMTISGSQEGMAHIAWALCNPGDTVLVPAKWFTGQLRRMSNPFLYGNEVVARGLQADSVAEGTIVEWEEDDNRRHNYWAGSYLERDARMITKRRTDSRIFVTMDGQRDTSALHLDSTPS